MMEVLDDLYWLRDPRLHKNPLRLSTVVRPMELPVPSYETTDDDRRFGNKKIEEFPCAETPKRIFFKIDNRRYRGYPMARTRKLNTRKLTYPTNSENQDLEEDYDQNKKIALYRIFGKRASVEIKIL